MLDFSDEIIYDLSRFLFFNIQVQGKKIGLKLSKQYKDYYTGHESCLLTKQAQLNLI